jgi:hypothetical protein
MYNTDLLNLIENSVLDKTVDDLNEEVTELAASVGEVITA